MRLWPTISMAHSVTTYNIDSFIRLTISKATNKTLHDSWLRSIITANLLKLTDDVRSTADLNREFHVVFDACAVMQITETNSITGWCRYTVQQLHNTNSVTQLSNHSTVYIFGHRTQYDNDRSVIGIIMSSVCPSVHFILVLLLIHLFNSSGCTV